MLCHFDLSHLHCHLKMVSAHVPGKMLVMWTTVDDLRHRGINRIMFINYKVYVCVWI